MLKRILSKIASGNKAPNDASAARPNSKAAPVPNPDALFLEKLTEPGAAALAAQQRSHEARLNLACCVLTAPKVKDDVKIAMANTLRPRTMPELKTPGQARKLVMLAHTSREHFWTAQSAIVECERADGLCFWGDDSLSPKEIQARFTARAQAMTATPWSFESGTYTVADWAAQLYDAMDQAHWLQGNTGIYNASTCEPLQAHEGSSTGDEVD